jgi:hypothetical protein
MNLAPLKPRAILGFVVERRWRSVLSDKSLAGSIICR